METGNALEMTFSMTSQGPRSTDEFPSALIISFSLPDLLSLPLGGNLDCVKCSASDLQFPKMFQSLAGKLDAPHFPLATCWPS